MKRFLILATAAFVAAALIAITGCARPVKVTVIDENTGIIIVPDGKISEIDEGTSFADYLTALKARGDIDFEATQSDYGLYITSINGTANVDNADNTGCFWAFYIDFTEIDGVIYGTDYALCEYEGKTLYSSSYGVSGTPCLDGHTYAFVYEPYSYAG